MSEKDLNKNLEEHLKKRKNQSFTYRKEYFFPLIKEENKSLNSIRVEGSFDKEKYNDLIKNYSN